MKATIVALSMRCILLQKSPRQRALGKVRISVGDARFVPFALAAMRDQFILEKLAKCRLFLRKPLLLWLIDDIGKRQAAAGGMTYQTRRSAFMEATVCLFGKNF